MILLLLYCLASVCCFRCPEPLFFPLLGVPQVIAPRGTLGDSLFAAALKIPSTQISRGIPFFDQNGEIQPPDTKKISTPDGHPSKPTNQKPLKTSWTRMGMFLFQAPKNPQPSKTVLALNKSDLSQRFPRIKPFWLLTLVPPTLLARAVGNDHFCDTTKRASQRLTPI